MRYKVCMLIISFLFIFHEYALGKEKSIYINARTAVAIDGESGVVLYEKNPHESVPMASTTKIITALTAINRGKLDDYVTISRKATAVRGSTVGYNAGEKVTLRELLYGLLYKSGNDAAIAIAEHIGGTPEIFYSYMNECGKNIGLINSSFNSPHGLDTENHYSSAYDLALATRTAMRNEVFREIVGTKEIKKEKYGFTRDYHNINKILSIIPEANGVKTGYTGKAGKCLVSSMRFHGRDIIIVVLNSPDRWNQTAKIFDYVKENYETCQYESLNIPEKHDLMKLNLLTEDKLSVEVPKEGIETKICLINPQYNILKGDYIGYIQILRKNTDEELYRKNLFSNKNISKKSFNKIINQSKLPSE